MKLSRDAIFEELWKMGTLRKFFWDNQETIKEIRSHFVKARCFPISKRKLRKREDYVKFLVPCQILEVKFKDYF